MVKSILVAAYACPALLFAVPITAQIKGNPVFSGKPSVLQIQKTGSRLSPELQDLSLASSGARKTGTNNALARYLQLQGNSVLVDITIKENMTASTKLLEKAGLQVTGVYGRVISGNIPISALSQIENIRTVQFARPAFKPMHQRVSTNATARQRYNPPGGGKRPAAVVSQGDTAQGSYLARSLYHVNGRGTKVGILSDSYNNLGTADAGVLHGELPGPGNPFNFRKPVDVLEDLQSNGSDEGRAMAEIVHEVAPGAELAFHTGFAGTANFAQGIQQLADKGCQVIVDDVAYYEEPFFQDGIIAQSIDLAKKRGVTYFTAAGNNSNASYESDYRGSTDEVLGPGTGTAHNFNNPGIIPRYFQPVYIPSGGSLLTSFQWDQPCFSAGGAGASSDLDIYLIDMYGSVVASAKADNIASGDPIEIMAFDNHTPDYTFFIVILKFTGPDPGHIKYNMYKEGQFFETSPAIPGLHAPSLVGHATAAGAITTAAAFYQTTPAYGVDTAQAEWFSSEGGVPNMFDDAGSRTAAVIRKKPDITAPDGGNSSFFDPFGNGDIPTDPDAYPNFFGTSAAAPHAAGVAALMRDAEHHNNLTPDQIRGIMTAHALDMDDASTPAFDKGFDFSTGAGFIQAAAAVGEVKFPNRYIRDLELKPVCSTDPASTRSWKILNPNPFEVKSHWLLLGSNQDGDITAPPGETVFSNNTFAFGSYQLPNIVILDWDDNFGFTRLDIGASVNLRCGVSGSREVGQEANAPVIKPMIADVFPNPSAGAFRLYLALQDQEAVELQLFSIDGKQLMQKRVAQGRAVVTLDAGAYKPGIYILQIRQGAFNKTIKLVKR